MNIWLAITLILVFLAILVQSMWLATERSDNARLRAANERRRRRFGTHQQMIGTIGDLSEGTLSEKHAFHIALWITDDYHTDDCAIALGYNACTCPRRPE